LEFPVRAGDRDPAQLGTIRRLDGREALLSSEHEPAVRVVELDGDLAVFHAARAEDRAGGRAAASVSLCERPAREPLADILLVARVDVARLADIDRHGHAEPGQGGRLDLLLAEFGPAVAHRGVVRIARLVVGELHEVEWKLGLPPRRAPAVHQRLHLLEVARRGAGVRLALIPKRTADRVGDERGNHAVVQARELLFVAGDPRLLGRGRECTPVGHRGLRAGQPFPDPLEVGLEIRLPLGGGRRGFARLRGQLGQSLRFLGRLRTDPRLDARAAERGVEQSDRHIQLPHDVPREEIPRGGELPYRLRRADDPRRIHRFGGEGQVFARDFEMPDERLVRIRLLALEVRGLLHDPLHVRLARAQPDVADEHVGERERTSAADGQGPRLLARGKRR
jgi:hypothetical protein